MMRVPEDEVIIWTLDEFRVLSEEEVKRFKGSHKCRLPRR
jgi:hypothetical protein